MKIQELKKIYNTSDSKKIIVVGDLMLDRYTPGRIENINPEQPAAHNVRITNGNYDSLGGAANVARNVISLGSKCELYGIIGDDRNGEKLKQSCMMYGVGFKGIISEFPTIVKQRIIAHSQQVIRLNWGEEDKNPNGLEKINLNQENIIYLKLEESLKNKKFDFIILSDYNKRVFTKGLAEKIIKLANNKNIPILTDPKPKNIGYFKNSTLVCPNQNEAEEISGIKYSDNKSLIEMSKKIFNLTKSKYTIITCGKKGSFVYSDLGLEKIETKAKEVIDVSGAGDTFTAAIAVGMSCGLDIFKANKFANFASGVVVEKLGTADVRLEEIIKKFKGQDL